MPSLFEKRSITNWITDQLLFFHDPSSDIFQPRRVLPNYSQLPGWQFLRQFEKLIEIQQTITLCV